MIRTAFSDHRTAAVRQGRFARAVGAVGCVASVLSACDQRGGVPSETAGATAAGDSTRVTSGAVSIAESLRRFREGLTPVTAFSGAAPSRDSLVWRFARAVERRDTLAVREMTLSRAEFAYLYYPSTQYVRRPYELAPETLWFLSQQNSEKGIGRVLQRYGGRPLGLLDNRCPRAVTAQGENRLWEECVVRYRLAGVDSAEQRRLFGAIIERGGRYKFVSYANDF